MKGKEFEAYCERIKPELIATLRGIHSDIHWNDPDLYDPESEIASIQITISCNDSLETWSIQTGDNSYTGSCYGDPYWGIAYLTEDSQFDSLADSLLDSLSEVIQFDYEE